ncbi:MULTISPECIES: inositol monophosphatase family protein [Microbacterium]|uniref:inositol monophosphatase family protein n=1 Tax=Microbacterium TaxID=33882 RepID=UPI000C2C9044|nr:MULTISPECIES: inositol monophosphatase family protein [Microbacterium]MDO8383395.1 inositol monophosphatase family protein [Microbacterium sp.]
MDSDAELLSLAVEIAREAGELARTRRDQGVAIAATKSGLADIVTEADREVEQLIRDRIAAARPDDGFLGEESAAEEGSSGLTWVVDPIDGTVNYAYGIPAYAVSIAVVEGPPDPGVWTAVAGVVNNPATGELFHASRGEGAYLGSQRLAILGEPDASGALIATGMSYDPERRTQQFEILGRVLPLARDIRRIGAASLDLAFVAAGRFDAYYEWGLWPWDMAAGSLLVSEAGGVVGGLAGARAGRDLLIAASPEFYGSLEAVLAG